MPDYTGLGKALLSRIAKEELSPCPALAPCCFPARSGFADNDVWRFNPGYLPPQLAQYFTRYGAPWTTLRETNLRLIIETAPKGFSPDWVRYQKNKGWQLQSDKSLTGSYDAIRVYAWAGMMHDSDPQKARLLARLKPMETMTAKQGVPPEKVNVATGKAQGMALWVSRRYCCRFYRIVMLRRCSVSGWRITSPAKTPITVMF
jgi:endoglucanase